MSSIFTIRGKRISSGVGYESIRKRGYFVLPLAVTLIGFFFFISPPNTYAAATTTTYELDPKTPYESTVACAGLNGSWSNGTSTCTLWPAHNFILEPGGSIRVEAGASLNITGPVLTISSGSSLVNFGTINNDGFIYSPGVIDNRKDGIINVGFGVPIGYSISLSGAIINNSGVIVLKSGDITSYRAFVNSGTIVIDGGRFDNGGGAHLENLGNITNKANLNNYDRINNYGSIDNYNGSRIYNVDSGTIANYRGGRINNDGGTIFNMGGIENAGVIINKGVIDSYGPITNSWDILNNGPSGVIINHNIGTIDNKGGIDNSGNITTVWGRFDNSGIIRNGCDGVISGTISGNPVPNACTSTTTTTTTSTFTATTSIERVAEPAIYAWAIGATVATVILAVILLLRRTR